MARLPSAFEELADLTWALANGRLEAEAHCACGNCSTRMRPICGHISG